VIYLLDTNACVTHLRNKNALLTHRIRAKSPGDLAVCSVVVGELFHGAERSVDPVKGRAQVEKFLQPFLSLPFEDAAAREYARVRSDLERRGTPIGDNDMLIAAIAVVNGLRLVTHNTAEFSRIPNLIIEDWEVP